MAAVAVQSNMAMRNNVKPAFEPRNRASSTPIDAAELTRRLETYCRTETRKERKDSRNSPKETPTEEKKESPLLASSSKLPYVPRYADRIPDVSGSKEEAERKKKANRHSYHPGAESLSTTLPHSTSLPAVHFPDPFNHQRMLKSQLNGENGVSRSKSMRHTRDLHYSDAQSRLISLALLEGRPSDEQPARSKARPASMYVDPYASGHLPSSQMFTTALHDALTALPEAPRPRLQPHDRHNWEQASQAGSDAGDFLHLKSIRRKHAKASSEGAVMPKLARIESAGPPAGSQSQTVRPVWNETSTKPQEKRKSAVVPNENGRPAKRGFFSFFRRRRTVKT
ncbi:hypothetical protein MBLNU457_g2530t1 [Dothideomycetes sp. NU457]